MWLLEILLKTLRGLYWFHFGELGFVFVHEHVGMCICMTVRDSGAVRWSLLSGYNGPARGLNSTKRPSLNNTPSQIEEEPDQSITTLKGSQSFP